MTDLGLSGTGCTSTACQGFADKKRGSATSRPTLVFSWIDGMLSVDNLSVFILVWSKVFCVLVHCTQAHTH